MQESCTNLIRMAIDLARSKHPDTKDQYSFEMIGAAVGWSGSKVKMWYYGQSEPAEKDIINLAIYLGEETWLPYRWLCQNSEIARKYLPVQPNKELTEAVLGFEDELNEIQKHIPELVKIARDGKITPDEVDRFKPIEKALIDFNHTIIELLNANQKSE